MINPKSAPSVCLASLVLGLFGASLVTAAPRVLPSGELPRDSRLGELKDLDGYFPFRPPAGLSAWERRASELRRQLLVSQGLWPMPQKTPLNPVIHGRMDLGDYTVEKVFFESMPGFFVTGNLYRPASGAGPFPAVLSPHGHWSQGRFYDCGPQEIRRLIVQGAERFEEGGRNPLQARCVQLARMGCVVFHYDMIGYADSVQISEELAHRFARQRPELNQPENWGLYSPAAESHLQSVMGLHTWNSIRALDFLAGLPDVDPGRIAVTGASGGGTQTFMLCAIDDRPAVSFPAVMVSTAMQGGCTCENAALLRIGTGNVEFAALFAPKPLGLTAANDWTREMATKGFPELQELYGLFDARNRVALTPLLHFGHNFNYVSRAAMYHWVNRHLALGLEEPIVEADYRRLTREQLTVWNNAHPQPQGGPEFEQQLLGWWHQDTQRALRQAAESPETFQEILGGGVRALFPPASEPREATGTVVRQERVGGFNTLVVRLRCEARGEELPVLVLRPPQPGERTLIWLDPVGKAGLFTAENRLRSEVQALLDAGITVVGVDLLFQGEFLADGQPMTRTRRVKNPRESAGYTFGYNPSLFAQRVHDVLTTAAWLQAPESGAAPDTSGPRLGIVGFGEAGSWAAAARALAPETFGIAAIHTAGFRFGEVTDLHDPRFLPGGARYFDLPGMIALGAPQRLWLAGEGTRREELHPVIRRAYGQDPTLTLAAEPANALADAVAWLVQTWD